MSRIGLVPIAIPKEVTVTPSEGQIVVKGPKGTLTLSVPRELKLSIADESISLTAREEKGDTSRSLHGLTRTLISNAIVGTTKGWEKTVELVGVGFRAAGGATEVTLTVGFSHQVKYIAPPTITFTIKDNTKITVAGIDKGLVGETAARLRAIRPPEPYKGKGIRYLGEIVRKKAGKAVKAAGATG